MGRRAQTPTMTVVGPLLWQGLVEFIDEHVPEEEGQEEEEGGEGAGEGEAGEGAAGEAKQEL